MCLIHNNLFGPRVLVAVNQLANNIVDAVRYGSTFRFDNNLKAPVLPGYRIWKSVNFTDNAYDFKNYQRTVYFLYETNEQHTINMFNWQEKDDFFQFLGYTLYCNWLHKEQIEKETRRPISTARDLHNKARNFRRKTNYLLKYKILDMARLRTKIIYEELMQKALHPSRILQWIDDV